MQNSEVERRIPILLPDRGQYLYAAELQLEGCVRDFTLTITHLDSVQPLAARLRHLCGDSMGAVASEAIDARAQQEVSSDVFGPTEELVDITLPITNMDTEFGAFEQRRRPLQVIEPTDTLLLFDWHACRVDPFLQRVRPL